MEVAFNCHEGKLSRATSHSNNVERTKNALLSAAEQEATSVLLVNTFKNPQRADLSSAGVFHGRSSCGGCQ